MSDAQACRHDREEAVVKLQVPVPLECVKQSFDTELLLGFVLCFRDSVRAEAKPIPLGQRHSMLFTGCSGQQPDWDAAGFLNAGGKARGEVDKRQLPGCDITKLSGLLVQDPVDHREGLGRA